MRNLDQAMRGAGLPAVEQDAILATSLLSRTRLVAMIGAIELAHNASGDTAEIGAAHGGTSRLIALLNGQRRHWCCDTFEGLVDVCEHDTLTNGQFHNPIEKVRGALEGVSNVEFVVGYFPDSAPQAMQDARYSLVHIDVDTYTSIKRCFEFFAPRMSRGAVMVLDDVLEPNGCVGAIRAFEELPRNGWTVVSETPPQCVIRFQ